MNTTTNQTPGQKFEAARVAVMAAEAAGRSERTVNKLWRAYFKAEDELKANGGWR